MSRHIHNILVVVALMCSTAVAQDRPTDADSATMMVTGCVQRTEQPGTLGATIPGRTATPENVGSLANAGEPAQGFILAGAATDFSSGLKPGVRADLPKRYILVGGDNDLAKLEGQRVRVTGKIVRSTKPEDTPVGTSGSTAIKSDTQRLKVSAVEVIEGKCSPQ